MQPIDIQNGCVNLCLTPSQCASLAKACQFASRHAFSNEIDQWHTFAALFHACAVAGFAQWHMCPTDTSQMDRELEISGLRAVDIEEANTEPISTINNQQKGQP